MPISPSDFPPDPQRDRLFHRSNPLDAIFAPASVAVIGATERPGSVGRTVLWNLISSPFGGVVFPVNPQRQNVLGIKAYPSIGQVPEPVDLAVIATPAPTVPDLIRDCVEAGVKGAIVLSVGFKETGATGVERERQIREQIAHTKFRLIGPNCLGVMNPIQGLNATCANAIARPGNVAFISQSGALCSAILDWSFQEKVGFSAFVSVGSMVDVDWGDIISYLGEDPHTKSIVVYMETIANARSFLSAARKVALSKPIIVTKAGRTEASVQAAISHTGILTGRDGVLDAAFRRSGILRVNTINELFDMAEVLAKQPRPPQQRLAILTNAGGPGLLATDALLRQGGELANLSPETLAELDRLLPAHWNHQNPIDLLEDADPERYGKAVEIVAKDPNTDGILVILTPQVQTQPTATAERLKAFVEMQRHKGLRGKTLLASWMGGADVAPGEAILNEAGIFTLPFPDVAAQVFNYMGCYSYNLKGLYETPTLPRGEGKNQAVADSMIHTVRQAGKTLLTEYDSKQLLAAYGIPVVDTRVATTEEEAVELSDRLGYPVVLKLFSHSITHKTAVGGVRLNLPDAETVRKAYRAIVQSVTERVGADQFQGVTVQPMLKLEGYELILGSSIDPQFGPVLLFGTGGPLVEVFQDISLALPPLNTTLARRMMEQTQIYKALQGQRGYPPIDISALEQLLVRFSQLVAEQPWIKEIDINPLLASPDHLVALDARIVLHDPTTPETELPKLAIRPYPLQYVQPWNLKNGQIVIIRPIRPEDEPLMVKFHATLSEQSVYFRYFHLVALKQRTSHDRLVQICFADYDREMVLVAEGADPKTGEAEIFGVARLSKQYGTDSAEFSLLVSDRIQGQGLGTELMRRLLQVGREEQLHRIWGEILVENTAMQRICEKLGFCLQRVDADLVNAEIDL
ncbi:bifunctional acetate--CoA ligase family protein/GNAT family N-acetyltransferase [Leptodesmis sp.]|uniref:bifunctional acetate--CoA ligase family protein/GNAT family N-acetyltransferase n=1 Tax=Leptodesmis sp. TaxID=3100501 RepID=UPI00405347E3